MLERVITAALLVVSIIHLLPITGFLGASKLSLLYGVDIADPNLEILMRHRAILFGILGALFAYTAFRPELQAMAFIIGFASVLSFFYLSYTVGGFNEAIRKVVIADIVALLALLLASTLYYFKTSR
jgi:hypothetical protein